MAVKTLAVGSVKFAEPVPTLALRDAVGLIVGIVVGAGIFRTPPSVAANVGSEVSFLLLWVAGGAITLIGALCYAELTSTYPHTGGDYHYLTRAYGKPLAFLFAWSRASVIQTGSLALLAFVSGDYASQLLRLGEYSSSIYAAVVVVMLTGLNMIGVHHGTRTQNLLTAVEVLSLLLVIVGGLFLADSAAPVAVATPASSHTAIGLAMVFVLLTYGGWNEAAYISAETTDRRDVARALLFGIAIITVLYLLVNWAYLRALGLSGIAASKTVAADVMMRSVGERGSQFVSLLVVISALTSANATIFTGARTNYAVGRDFRLFRFLGRWRKDRNTPANSLVIQGLIALGLILIGTRTRKGFETMVDFTAPVFWFFFFMVGLSLIILRQKDGNIKRPFRAPFHPLLPIAFCASCLYMLQASLAYIRVGALAGVAVVLAGLPVYFVARSSQVEAPEVEENKSETKT
ncbi:MAG TPA: amino acid permease [Pyrinomonadaceae bacterium]|nr:amino acid permease [Pyrinomonadaceae bacterium]